MAITTVGVVGCGQMGGGITQVAAQAGYHTIVREATHELVNQGIGRIDKFLGSAVKKEKISEDEKQAVLGRITGTTDFADFGSCDIIIEAITENVDVKKEVFRAVDKVAPGHAILASNTSSISITELAAVTGRPQQVIGLHFFNPVPIMNLIEMVIGLTTSDETTATARQFGESMNKKVIVAQDTPGFIVNYLLIPYLLDAIRLVESGTATKEDVDAGMVLGCSHPMGPFKLIDFIGLDTTLYIADVLYEAFRTDRYAAPPLLRKMVTAGYMGRKSGRGFYEY